MAYFVHNKYDKASIDALETIGVGQTLVDFYTDYETYKYLDTSAGFGILYDELSYITPGTVINDGQADNDNSHFNFQSSIIVKSIQRGTFEAVRSGDVTININEIDPTKAFVVLNNGYSNVPVFLKALEKTYFIATNNSGSGSGDISYQIIEFC